MLEVMYMSAGIDINILVLLEYREESLLHVCALALALRCLGIYGMVAYDNDPCLVCCGEC